MIEAYYQLLTIVVGVYRQLRERWRTTPTEPDVPTLEGVFAELAVNGSQMNDALTTLGPSLEQLLHAQTAFGNAIAEANASINVSGHPFTVPYHPPSYMPGQGGIVPAGPPPTITGFTFSGYIPNQPISPEQPGAYAVLPTYDHGAPPQGGTGVLAPLQPVPVLAAPGKRAIALDGIEEDQ